MIRATLDASPALKLPAGHKVHYALADSLGELADMAKARGVQNREASEWNGHKTLDQACAACREGEPALVASSDALLANFEEYSFQTPSKFWQRSVAGQRPDIPAMLSGHPMTMRRRVKMVSDMAPLAVIVDMTTSAGIPAETIEKRGAAILAVCRMLAARRPVELWAGCLLDADNLKNCSALFARIDTAPLDLARAAFALVSPSYPRQMLYALGKGAFGFKGGWPFNKYGLSKRHLWDIMAPAMPWIGDALPIPAADMDDDISKDPAQWVQDTLARLGGAREEAA